jgi:transcriptional regulator with XRE-family HTH domain
MKKEILVKFGNKVRAERMKLGLSQEELAERAGVHRTYIGMIERAEKNITLENIEKICKALNMSISDCFKDL